MLKKILDKFKIDHIGMDIFNDPILYVDNRLNISSKISLKDIAKDVLQDNSIKEESRHAIADNINLIRSNKRYNYKKISMEYIAKQVTKTLKKKINTPKFILSIPFSLDADEFKTELLDAFCKFGSETYLIPFEMASFIGSDFGLNVMDDKYIYRKKIFMHMVDNNICFTLHYCGAIYSHNYMYLDMNITSLSDIKLGIDQCLSGLPCECPLDLKVFDEKTKDLIIKGWEQPLCEEYFIAAPDSIVEKLNAILKDYKLVFSKNYETCVLGGIRKVFEEVKELKTAIFSD